MKQAALNEKLEQLDGFGVTYEGLKPIYATKFGQLEGCFGVTYEGLKPIEAYVSM